MRPCPAIELGWRVGTIRSRFFAPNGPLSPPSVLQPGIVEYLLTIQGTHAGFLTVRLFGMTTAQPFIPNSRTVRRGAPSQREEASEILNAYILAWPLTSQLPEWRTNP